MARDHVATASWVDGVRPQPDAREIEFGPWPQRVTAPLQCEASRGPISESLSAATRTTYSIVLVACESSCGACVA